MFGFGKKKRSPVALVTGVSIAAMGAAAPGVAGAQEQARITDEIVVTAEKREASIQDVPIAVSAFDEEKLDRMQINDGQDLALAIPNFQFAKSNFTGTNIAIRGIGAKVVAASGDAAVGLHINGAPNGASRIFETEFYDVQRVEVLRGPQGTLYGRNASAGVLNIITAKPEYEEFTGAFEVTGGNFETRKARAMVNVPFGEDIALRVAGFTTNRDGFTENLATNQSIDGRDMNSYRISLGIELSDRDELNIMGEFFHESSDRSRIGKQLCDKDTRPWPFTQGCLPTGTGFGTINGAATLGGYFTFLPGLAFGAPALNLHNQGQDPFAGSVNPSDLRKVVSPFTPTHKADNDYYQLEYSHRFDFGTFTSLTSYSQDEIVSKVDYSQNTPSATFNPNVFFPGPVQITSSNGTFVPANFGDPTLPGRNRLFTYDQSDAYSETLTQELRFVSDLDGPFNFSLGGIYIDGQGSGSYYVFSNSLAFNGILFGANPDLWYFRNYTDNYQLDATAVFGEAYYNFTDNLKFTLGVRQTNDEKSVTDRASLLSQQPLTTVFTGGLIPPGQQLCPGSTTALCYTVRTSDGAIVPNGGGPFYSSQNAIPFSTRAAEFEEITGRAGFDWQTSLPFTDESNLYAFYSKGYKGGGLNPPFDPALFQGVPSTFEPEFINSYEIGAKNVLADGRMVANFTGFYYDYEGYQVSKIVNRTSVNENIDATVKGFEAEFTYEPVNGLVFDLNASWLDSEIGNSSSIDPINANAGNPNFTVVKTSAASLCVIPTANLAAALAAGGGGTIAAPTAAGQGIALAACTPWTQAPGSALDTLFRATGIINNATNRAIATDGIATNLNGKKLPNTPEYQISFGAQYTFNVTDAWSVTPRADYYYQDESFSRIFNGAVDKLDSYQQINASLRIENQEKGVYANLFVKNIEDEDVITDKYLTDASSGLFTNAFLLEPRTYGISIGKRW
jgi:outer membrane receptor protein involved in Fe transport